MRSGRRSLAGRHKTSRFFKEVDRRIAGNLNEPASEMLRHCPFRQRTTDFDKSLLGQIIRRRRMADFTLDVRKNLGAEFLRQHFAKTASEVQRYSSIKMTVRAKKGRRENAECQLQGTVRTGPSKLVIGQSLRFS